MGESLQKLFEGYREGYALPGAVYKDPEIYADIVRAYPGRILAVYIREVRLDPGDGRVEKVSGAWDQDVPFVLAADSDAIRRHATELGLL